MKFKNIMCAVCGAVCDDIEVDLTGEEIKVYNACKLGEAKFHELRSRDRITNPLMDGGAAGWDKALAKSAQILKSAKHPIIFLGSEISTEAVGVGIEIAEHLGGVVDSHPTICHGPTVMGIQEAGLPTATLGEVKNRADLIIYWGANPMESHLRHMSRYSIFPRGYFRREGMKERTVVVVDPRKTPTTKLADLHVRVEPNKDYELLSAIGSILRGCDITEDVGGVDTDTIHRLAEMMKNCKFGVIFIGLGLASSVGKYRNLEKAMKVVRYINKFTRFILLPNLGHGNVSGFLQAMTWQSGFPFGVDYSRGYPRYNPGEFTTVDLLRNGEVDAMLIVAADLATSLPRDVVEFMGEIPTVSIDIAPCPTTLISDVVLPGVIMGMESGGTIYRMDHVPLALRKFTEPPFNFTESDEDTLKQLFKKIKELG